MTRVIVADAPVPDLRRRSFDLAPGPAMTVAEIVAAMLPGLSEADAARVRVTIGGAQDAVAIPQEQWRQVRPRAGSVVCIRYVPGDPFGIGIWAALNGVTGFGLSAGVASAIGFAASATVLFAGARLANSLIPKTPKRKELPEAKDLYQIDGWQNSANIDEAIPFPVGRIRMAPLFAARPYAEIIDGEQYLLGLFLWGHGPLDITELKIKDTPIGEFPGVTVYSHAGTPTDSPLQMIREQVIEDRLGMELDRPDPTPVYQTWTSPLQTDRVRVILQCPGGVARIKDGQYLKWHEVWVRIMQRQVGTADWVLVQDVQIAGQTNSGFFRQVEWRTPSRGAWEVQVWRVSGDSGMEYTDTVWLSSIAGIREQSPIAHDGPLAISEVRVKASAMANGTLDAFNGVVVRQGHVWNGSEWSWGLTRNPASAALAILLSEAGAWPVDPSQIHWDDFAALFTLCYWKDLKYDAVLSGDQTFGEVLHQALAAGRATWRRDGTGWGIIIDQPQAHVVDRISPLNATQIRWSRPYIRRPDAIRVTFRDQTAGWEKAEMIVPWPGFVGVPEVFEDWSDDGKTDPVEVWRETRRRQHELDLRADTITCIQAGAVRHATRGDEVDLSCDILDEIHVAARVRSVAGRTVELDTPVTMADGLAYALKWQVYDAVDTVGDAVQASIVTQAGTHALLLFPVGSPLPPVDAEVHFGLATRLAIRCKIVSVEPAQDMSYRLTLQPAAPELETLTDAEVAPSWTRLAGDAVSVSGTPDAPIIGTITSEPAEYVYSGVPLAQVFVPVSLPYTNAVPVGWIWVWHRVTGSGAWSITTLPGTSGVVQLSYPLGSAITVYATAVSVYGDPSSPSPIQYHDVEGAVGLPTALDLGSMSIASGLGWAQITLATAADTREVQLFRVPDGATLDTVAHAIGSPVTVASGSSVSLIDGDVTRADILDAGDMSDAGAWTATDVTITGGQAEHVTGTIGDLTQALTLEAGATYRGEIVVSGRTAGTITVRLTGGTTVEAAPIDTDGAHLLSLTAASGNTAIEIEWSSDCDADVLSVLLYRSSTTAAPQGVAAYYVAPINGDQIANAPSGPLSARII